MENIHDEKIIEASVWLYIFYLADDIVIAFKRTDYLRQIESLGLRWTVIEIE